MDVDAHVWMMDQGVVGAVMASMRTFSEAEDIQECGCHFIGLLCYTGMSELEELNWNAKFA